MRLWGITTEFVGFISPEPCAELYCVRLKNWSILITFSLDEVMKLRGEV